MRLLLFAWLTLLLFLCVWARTENEDEELQAISKARSAAFRAAVASLGPGRATIETAIDDVLTKSGLSAEALDAARMRLLRFLFLASGWASIGSLDGLVQQVSKNGFNLSIDAKGASLGDFLFYLNSKGHFPGQKLHYFRSRYDSDVETEQGKFTLLLDTMMLRRLNDVPSFLANVVKDTNEFTFVAPFGYEAINMFTTATLPQLAARLHQLLQKTKFKFGDSQSPREDFAWMCGVLKALVTDKLPAEKDYEWNVEFVFPPQFDFVDDDEALARFYQLGADTLMSRLAGNFNPGLLYGEWLNIFAMYSSDVSTQREIAETLRDSGNFFSFEMLGEFSRAISAQIEAHIAKPAAMDDLKFLVPIPGKSFGVATMIFFLNHPELSTHTIVKSVGSLMHNAEAQSAMRAVCAHAPACVILDDFAGSGGSLVALAEPLTDDVSGDPQVKAKHLFLCPFVQTAIARATMLTFTGVHPGVPSFAGTKLAPAPEYRDWMGRTGFAHGTYFVSLPYMAPDNNNAFMAYIVAPFVVLNGLGSKMPAGDPPPFLFKYLGHKHFGKFVSDHNLPRVTPSAVVTSSGVCKRVGSSTPIIFIEFRCNQVVDLDQLVFSTSGMWNWVLTEDFELLFSQFKLLDRLHSRCQLAGPTTKVYLGGELEISGEGLRVYIDPQYTDTRADMVVANFADLMRLFNPFARTVQSLDPLLPDITYADLRNNCQYPFSILFSPEMGKVFVDRGKPRSRDRAPLGVGELLNFCAVPQEEICPS